MSAYSGVFKGSTCISKPIALWVPPVVLCTISWPTNLEKLDNSTKQDHHAIYGAVEIREAQYHCYKKKKSLPCKVNLRKKSRTVSVGKIFSKG